MGKVTSHDGEGQSVSVHFNGPLSFDREHVSSQAWFDSADRLAGWASERLVNRRDAHGAYLPLDQRKDGNARTRRSEATLDTLRRHFEGADQGHLVGLHSSSADGACRWVAWDIDAHDGDGADPAANLEYALLLVERLRDRDLPTLLIDSNGAGGYHVWLILDQPIPLDRAHGLARLLVADCEQHGLAGVETFPKQARLGGKGLGNWLRLPGRHHTRDHWSRVWNVATGSWVEGAAAVEALLSSSSADPATVEAALVEVEAAAVAERPATRKKPRERGAAHHTRASAGGQPTADEIARVEAALGYLDPDDYDSWIAAGMALREWGPVGLSLWQTWSAGSPKYTPEECQVKWDTFGTEGRTVASLIHDARAAGWVDPWQARNGLAGPTERSAAVPRLNGAMRPAERPAVEVGTREDLTLRDALAALATHPDVYCRAGRLVRVAVEENPLRLGAAEVAVEAPRILDLTPHTVAVYLSAVADLFSWRKDASGEDKAVRVRCPGWLADACVEHGIYPGFRRLDGGIADAPFPRPDGSLVLASGYDQATRTLLVAAVEVGSIAREPTRDDARAAASRLLAVVSDFPWADPADPAAWLALVLSLVARPGIRGCVPGFLLTANTRASGKTLLAKIAGLIATGAEPSMVDYPTDPQEAAKMTLSVALAGLRFLILDNVAEGGSVGNPALDRTLTAEFSDGRELGKSRMVGRVPTRSVWTATGNNIAARGDATRRWVPIRLDSPLERPEMREGFEHPDLLGWVRAHRGELVRDALIVLRAHAAAGYPSIGKPALGSFEDWDRVVRGAVYHATGSDPLTGLDQGVEADPERLAAAGILRGWLDLLRATGNQYIEVGDALRELKEHPSAYGELRDTLTEQTRDGELPNSRQFGVILRGLRGRWVEGMRLKTLGVHGTRNAYGVEVKDQG